MTDTPKRKVLYILSPGYSGSTLLALLMATHPDVATIGERRMLVKRLSEDETRMCDCLCGLPIPKCGFLSAAYEAGRGKLSSFTRGVDYTRFHLSENPRLNRIAFRLHRANESGRSDSFVSRWVSTQYRGVCEANAALIDFALERANAGVFLDASKNPSDLRHLRQSGLFDIRVIHLCRDGRGRYHSLLDRDPRRSTEKAARNVRDVFCRIKELLDEWEDPVVTVRYENLCRQPLGEIRRIAGEAGLDPDGVSLDYLTSTEHLMGNARVVASTTSRIVNREPWRTGLSGEELEAFERIAGESNRAFGYTD